MSLFKSIFGDKGQENPGVESIWNNLTHLDQLDQIQEEGGAVAIFKHSTRCSISRMALKQFERNFRAGSHKMYFLDLLQHRDISDAIAERFQVRHQSPQLILIKDGQLQYHASHDAISAEALDRYQ